METRRLERADRYPRGEGWLVLGRLGSAQLLAGLVLVSGDALRSTEQLYLAAAIAVVVAILGWVGRGRRHLLAPLFLADVGWVSLAVVGAGRVEMGLGLLFALVAFSAGLSLGGRTALAVSLAAGLALVVTVNGVPDLRVGPRWVLVQGMLVLVLGAASDRTRNHFVTQERALAVASEALEKMRLDTDTIVQNLASGVLSVNKSEQVVQVNRVAQKTLGLEESGVNGRLLPEVLPAGSEKLLDVFRRALSTGEQEQRVEIEVRRGGTTMPLGIGTTVLKGSDNEVTGVVALFQDLTEVRRQESLAKRRDRLAAVGELAAGIAHEIRNSILPISGSVQILAQEVGAKDERTKLFNVVEREMENIERFVGSLLSYSRTQDPHSGMVDLMSIAAAAADDAKLGTSKKVAIRVQGGRTRAWADEEQIRQAVRNLVMNAVDAVDAGGQITLRSGDTDGCPWIEVEDDGPGVPTEARKRIFKPFFTSKPGGTGLGLAIVSRIVEDHAGQLQLLEGAQGGARFRIVLNTVEAESRMPSHAA